MHKWGRFLLLLVVFLEGITTNAGTSRSANYSISSGSLNMGGRASSSASYSNVGFISVQQTDEAERPTATAGEGDSRIELRQTGFRIITRDALLKKDQRTSSSPKILNLIPHQNLAVGEPIRLEVDAVGTHPMTFQWYKGRDLLEGETSHSFTVERTTVQDTGAYKVLVRNSHGYSWGNKVYVNFLEPPVILKQPVDQTVVSGKTILLSVEATGSPRLRYQWFQNGAPIQRANGSVLRLKAITAFEGPFHVEVSNPITSIRSATATVQILQPPQIQNAPTNQLVVAGEEAVFSAVATGKDLFGETLSYQWYKGKNQLEGQTSDSLVIPSVSEDDAGVYVVEVSNSIGTIRSRPFRLRLQYPPEILRQPSEVTTRLGGKAYFYVKAWGSRNLQYQWYKDGEVIRKANRNRLRIYPVGPTDAGIYHVVIENKVGSAESESVALLMDEASISGGDPPDWKTSFSRWTVIEDLAEEETDPEADVDSDGVPNLLEYAFFGNPLSPETGISPESTLSVQQNGETYLKLSWREATEAKDLVYELQFSGDLKDWTTLDISNFPSSRTDSGTYTTVEVFLAVSTRKAGFYRVRVLMD